MTAGLCNFTLVVGKFTFLDLSVISPLPLENLFPLYYQNKTTNVLIKYCKVFFFGLLLLFCQVQPLFLAWIGLSSYRKPLGTVSRAHSQVSAWLPDILFRGINFALNNYPNFLFFFKKNIYIYKKKNPPYTHEAHVMRLVYIKRIQKVSYCLFFFFQKYP